MTINEHPRADTQPGMGPSCRFNDLLIEAFGVNGKNGRVGTLEREVKKLKSIQTKLVLGAVAGASLGGGAVHGIIKLFA